jgi:hypothetical protein
LAQAAVADQVERVEQVQTEPLVQQVKTVGVPLYTFKDFPTFFINVF